MQADRPALGHGKLISLLQDCRQRKDLHHAQRLLAYMRQQHLDSHPLLGNYLVPILTNCGLVVDAHDIFDRLPRRSEHSWTALISCHIDCGNIPRALHLYQKMQEENSALASSYTYVVLLNACTQLNDTERGRGFHNHVTKRGLDHDLYVSGALVHLYGKCGLPVDAHQVFDRLPIKNPVLWTTMIVGYAEHGLGIEALNYFRQMQLEGVPANVVTFAPCLKVCGTLGAPEKGQELHNAIAMRGFETELYIGSSLVDMYGKCGLLAEAEKVFNSLPDQNVISWTALISGYSQQGLGEQVLKCFNQMQLAGIKADAVTYTLCLKACGSMETLETGRKVHDEVRKSGLENNIMVGNMLIDMYCRCGSFAEGHDILNKLPVKDAVSWNSIIAAYVDQGLSEKARRCFQAMQLEGTVPDSITFVCMLKSCGSAGAPETGQHIHAEMVKRGLENGHPIGSTLVDVYCKCSLLPEASHVFEKLARQSAMAWTALIAGYSDAGLHEKVLNLFKQMQLEGVHVDDVTYVVCLKACGIIPVLETAQQINSEVTKKGMEGEICVGTTLVDLYCKFGLLAEAQHVFDRLSVRNAVLWTALLAGYLEYGSSEQVLRRFKQMQLEGVPADAITFILCLKACGSVGALETGREIHSGIRKAGLDRDPSVGNMLVDMYGKCGSLAEGREVFDILPIQSTVSWTTMIKAYVENMDSNMALHCYEEMEAQGVKPNAITFNCLIAACSHASLVSKGQHYFKVMREVHRIEPTVDHYASMVNLLARSGQLKEAERFVTAMQCASSNVILMSLLSACNMYGKVKQGQSYFHQLVDLNQEDAAAYLIMEDVYTSVGRWDDANRVEKLRKSVCASKKPGSALIEVNKNLREFVVGVNQNKGRSGISEHLISLMKSEGFVPNIDSVSGFIVDEEEANFHNHEDKYSELRCHFSSR